LETAISGTGTVSETASENGKMIVENGGGLRRITLDFTSVFAILLELNRTLQVPAGLYQVAGRNGRKLPVFRRLAPAPPARWWQEI